MSVSKIMAVMWRLVQQGDLAAIKKRFNRDGKILSYKDHEGDTLLLMSLNKDVTNEEIAHWIILQGANVDDANEEGFTPLMCACRNYMPNIAELLIDNNANVNAQDEKGWTALMYACHYAQPQIAIKLIERGAKVNAQLRQGWTPLMFACRYSVKGMAGVASLLISKGAEIDAVLDKGLSPLMLSCSKVAATKVPGNAQEHMFRCTQVLYAAGAQTHLKNSKDQDVLQYARVNGREDAVGFLDFAMESELSDILLHELRLPKQLIVELYDQGVLTEEDCRNIQIEDLAEMDCLTKPQCRKFLAKFAPVMKQPQIRVVARGGQRPQRRSSVTEIDTFLSHDWGHDEMGRNNHDRVRKLNRLLQNKELTTWFDDERLNGNIAQQISSGIERSQTVIVCITHNYMTKLQNTDKIDFCLAEFEAAAKKLGPKQMIPVVMEPQMLTQGKWKGPLALYMSHAIYLDFTSDSMMERNIDRLVAEIKQRSFYTAM